MGDPFMDPPGETILEPWLENPLPDYDTEPVMARTLPASDSGQTPRKAISDFLLGLLCFG